MDWKSRSSEVSTKPRKHTERRLAMEKADIKNCKNCYYFKQLYPGGERCCHYILIEGKRRPCPPGKDCTVKNTIKVYRKGQGHGKTA